MNEFLHWLEGTMATPTWFGWFHIMWLVIMISVCVLIYIFRNKISKKTVNIILIVTGIVLVIFEIYKQVIYTFDYHGVGEPATWSYRWWAFPFQFCSTPMYLMILAGILRKGKVYDCLTGYLATYALFAGLAVMFYPGGVFTSEIGINIQTMFWHSSMFMIGFLLLATRTVEFKFKTVLKATIVFAIMVSMALIMDILWHFYGTKSSFNMFYISPYYPCTLPLLEIIYANTPYVVFLLIYIIGFMLVASIMMGFAKTFNLLEKHIANRKAEKAKVENKN